ncbi:hypothetical protein SBRCBS47491_002365 [Sporothrix bragantina]|uniref:Zn(2)-C6 fungal-type domain-containing protein n=1 Tax=Sporothrix bragantina TaxID=671064 RepID=A0ABP0B6A6_9PEZI
MTPTPESVLDPDSSVQTRKRRRIAVACTECRLKKSRCDGGRPQCSLCIAHGIPCSYAQDAPPSGALTSSKAIFNRIESRLAQLESDVSVLKRADKSSNGPVDDELNDPARVHHRRQGLNAPHDDYAGASPDTTDGIGSIEFTDVPTSGYFGPSSNIQFMRNMRSAMAVVLGDIPPQVVNGSQAESDLSESARSQYMLQVSRPQSPMRRERPAWPQAGPSTRLVRSLPSDAEAQPLLHRYFSDTGLLFPYIHEASFYKDYNEFKASRFRQARRSWVGLLYAILAMATTTSAKTDTSVDRRASDADIFFTRAEELCLSDTLNGAGVETVQALLLISQFLQGTKRSVQTWSIHGLAVKSALQLGLHSEEFSKRLDPLDQEIRKRTWYGCVLLDRTLSMTFGRPASIPDHYVQVSLPRHLVCPAPDSNPSPWSSSESSTLFFNASIPVAVDLISGILDMEHELLDWQRSLPASICLLDHEELLCLDTHPDNRLRVILTLRYHNVRILVHRPLLEYYLVRVTMRMAPPPSSSGSPIPVLPVEPIPQASQRSFALLSSSAECIIKMVSTINDPASHKQHLLGAWWFSLYYTFNAALTIASVAICQRTIAGFLPLGSDASTLVSTPSGASLPFQNAKRLVEEASTCLPRLDTGNRIVEKCASLTRALCSVMSFLTLARGAQEAMERPNGTGAVPVPDISNGGEAFTSGDATQHANSWNLFSATDMNLNYGVDLAALLTGMMPQDQQSAPMDDVYYW